MPEDCFYACLREAQLEQYYHNFINSGINRSTLLTEISTKDYPLLGVLANQDQKRLVQLTDIIRKLDAKLDSSVNMSTSMISNRVPPPSVSTPQAIYGAVTGKSNVIPTKPVIFTRQRSSHSESDGDTLREEDQSEYFSPGRRSKYATRNSFHTSDQSNAFPSSSYFSGRYQSQAERNSDSEDDTTAPVSPDTSMRTPTKKTTPVVYQTQGYNYGVPNSNTSPSPTRKVARATGKSSDRIRVCVRKRPLLRKERQEEADVVRVNDANTVAVLEEKSALDLKKYTQQHEFLFDEAFEEDDANAEVFRRTVKPLINHVLEGGKSTCFAYGQTGSGKSYTIMGSASNPGLYALAGEQIFANLRSGQVVFVAFFEIYCGQLYDLLNARSKLHAREDGKQRVQISNLREVKVLNNRHLMQVVEVGSKSRSVGASGVNPDSSRSHAVLQIQIKMPTSRGESSKGRISFIDLAGSERAAEAGDQDKITRQEGAEINTSLLALKECIRALDQDSKHTPFRQSKLTQVLKESFIGNSKTCMIANISPTSSACDNTLNTLRYADRVKELRKQGLLGGGGSSSASSSPSKAGSPKMSRKSARVTSGGRAVPNVSQNEPNRTNSRKTKSSADNRVKRSSSDVTMATNRQSSMTFMEHENELYRSISLEANDMEALDNLDIPHPRNLPPEPEQATFALDSPRDSPRSSPSSGSNSPVSPAHTSERISSYGAAENSKFAANFLKNYATPPSRENANITRKSISSPDLRRDPDPAVESRIEGASAATGFVGYELNKINANTDMFLKKLKSSRKGGGVPSSGTRKVQAVRTQFDPHNSPRSQRKIVKFLGIESGTYSNFDESQIPAEAPQPVEPEASKENATPRRYYNSADDIRGVESPSETSPERQSTAVGTSKSVGKIRLVENKRRSPSQSEDESLIGATACQVDSQVQTDAQQPMPPHTPRPPRTSRDKTNSSPTPVPISKKMTLAEFAKSPPQKKGKAGSGSNENLSPQSGAVTVETDSLAPAEPIRKNSRNSSGDSTSSAQPGGAAAFARSQSLRSSRPKPQEVVQSVGKRARSQSPAAAAHNEASSVVGAVVVPPQTGGGGTPPNIIHKAQSQLVTAHKDHLAVVSKLCTKELGFLQEMEVGNKAFKEYAKQLDSTLTRKLKAINQMKAHIAEYNKLCEGK